MNVEKLVKEFFILDYSAAKPTYKLNEYTKLANYNWKNIQKAVEFFLEVIKYWHDKVRISCDKKVINSETGSLLPENEWSFRVSRNRQCDGCKTFYMILDAIFDQFHHRAGHGAFLELNLEVDRGYDYIIYFDILKAFVDGYKSAEKAAEIQVNELKMKRKEESRKTW